MVWHGVAWLSERVVYARPYALCLCISCTECSVHVLASFPGPAQLSVAVWKSGRGPGIFYHASNVEGREKVERT